MSVSIFVSDANFDADKVIGEVQFPHRYWRLSVLGTHGGINDRVAAVELELRTVAGGADITTPSTIISASSENLAGGNAVTDAIDNDTGTQWDTLLNPPFPVTVDVDLLAGNEEPVVEVSWLPRPDAPYWGPDALDIEFSDDGITWTNSWSVSGISGWTAGVAKVFTKP